ncbi:MAG: hypothetical protein QOG52_2548 [Frankiaceae bacterium]|nr:hypothetical protein [Frankiaceae bacterium]MDQ1725520.1 hypothetical protein [Frankiaceae bacterium]
MPESKGRKKPAYTPPPTAVKVRKRRAWIAPAMAVCFVLGIAWLTVWYIAQPHWMVGGNINLGIGFGLLLVGFALATKWE